MPLCARMLFGLHERLAPCLCVEHVCGTPGCMYTVCVCASLYLCWLSCARLPVDLRRRLIPGTLAGLPPGWLAWCWRLRLTFMCDVWRHPAIIEHWEVVGNLLIIIRPLRADREK